MRIFSRASLCTLLTGGILAVLPPSAHAGKPDDVVQWSNGFPSGSHFNLNVHGKKDGYICDSASSDGGSVFVPEYGQALITFTQNKASSSEVLQVPDACSSAPNDPAKVMLPSGEYQVYARILGKPGKQAGEHSVVFYPKLIDACDSLGSPDFATYTECQDDALLTAGKITVNGVFDKDSVILDRVAPLKGGNKAQNITPLFQWSGYVCDGTLDLNADGEITLADVSDMNGDGVVDDVDLALFLQQNCPWYESEWIFNIADMVTYGWDYMNSGAKLVQIRLYPMTTTEFVKVR